MAPRWPRYADDSLGILLRANMAGLAATADDAMTPPATRPGPARRPRLPWPWAMGSVGAVVLVLAATLLTHAVVLHVQSAALVVPAPGTPLLQVSAMTRPDGGARLIAFDSSAGVFDVLAAATANQPTTPQGCPPHARGCVSATIGGPADALLVLDDATGATRARSTLAGNCAAARGATALLDDPTSGRTYALDSTTLVTFDSKTGACLGTVPLPGASGVAGGPSPFGALVGAALAPTGGDLYLAYPNVVLLVDRTSGQLIRGGTSLGHETTLVAGPVLDPADNAVFVLSQDRDGTVLVVLAANTLRPMGGGPLPVGTRLGPLAPGLGALVLYGKNGKVSLASTSALLTTGGAVQASLQPISGLRGAAAFGWEPSTHGPGPVALTATASGAQMLSIIGMSAHLYATLPLPLAPLAGWQPLPVNGDGSVALIASDGTLVFVRLAPATSISPDEALLLARAALPRYLPETNQQPPFLAPSTFPLSAGTVARNYDIDFSDLGWQGPYSGSASVAVAAEPGEAGAYQVTYAIRWNQLFPRQHQWLVRVESDGSVRLVDSSGDAIP